jgi:hypothetical protein
MNLNFLIAFNTQDCTGIQITFLSHYLLTIDLWLMLLWLILILFVMLHAFACRKNACVRVLNCVCSISLRLHVAHISS